MVAPVDLDLAAMFDPTPPPLGDVTRLWTHLDDHARQHHIHRLLPGACPGDSPKHVDRPGRDRGNCYRHLLPAAVDGDPVAFGWLATTHRPLLITCGRPLFEHDPAEWGVTCLEILHRTISLADLTEARWARRRIARILQHRMVREVARHLRRREREHLTAPVRLNTLQPAVPALLDSPHPELTLALARALHPLDGITRDGLWALANHEPLAEVAARHAITHAALRQRVTRARQQLQSELATYHRGPVTRSSVEV